MTGHSSNKMKGKGVELINPQHVIDMKKTFPISSLTRTIFSLLILLVLFGCEEEPMTPGDRNNDFDGSPVLIVIDEESIDNGNEPNNFSETDVNDQLADIGFRQPLRFFSENIGKEIDLFTGQVGDEGWFAIRTIPDTWINAGPTNNGARNYLVAGPGLGASAPDDDREVLLDEVPDITPLRATGLAMLVGETVLAIVHDSDVSVNYSPLEGNLQGAYLGIVALDVLQVTERTDGSTSSLPRITVRIRDASAISALSLMLFANAPVPTSSSEPFDIAPPANPMQATLLPAD